MLILDERFIHDLQKFPHGFRFNSWAKTGQILTSRVRWFHPDFIDETHPSSIKHGHFQSQIHTSCMRMAYGVCLEFASIYSLNLNYSYVEKYDINIYIYIFVCIEAKISFKCTQHFANISSLGRLRVSLLHFIHSGHRTLGLPLATPGGCMSNYQRQAGVW